MIVHLFENADFSGNVYFFCFRLEMSFLRKFGLKNSNRQFKLKFGT